MEWFLVAVLGVTIVGIVAVAWHLAMIWADRRGWVYYRNEDRPPPRSIGLLEEIYQPSVEHVIEHEISEETRADQAESGDPETPGRSSGE